MTCCHPMVVSTDSILLYYHNISLSSNKFLEAILFIPLFVSWSPGNDTHNWNNIVSGVIGWSLVLCDSRNYAHLLEGQGVLVQPEARNV